MINKICELCLREGLTLTKHHLIPKEEGGTYNDLSLLCLPCHKMIHSLYSNKELATRLYTIQLLKNDYKVQKYLKWIKKQPFKSNIKIKRPNHRKNKRK